jgi:hypothetical protein
VLVWVFVLILLFLHIEQTQGVYVPRAKDLLELSLGIRFPVLAAFELHSLLGISQFLLSVSFAAFTA